jgi:hypothetical protein
VQAGQPVFAGGLGEVAPENAGADAGATTLGVDVQLRHRGCPEEDGVSEPALERWRAVAGALRGDLEPGLAGRGQHLGHLVRECRVDHGGRVVGHLEVPGGPGHVVGGVTREVDGAPAQPAKLRRARVSRTGSLQGHDISLLGIAAEQPRAAYLRTT